MVVVVGVVVVVVVVGKPPDTLSRGWQSEKSDWSSQDLCTPSMSISKPTPASMHPSSSHHGSFVVSAEN